ncbi:hypothetical protein [Brevundimonas denitrificans]|uniref:hypothetical protein n=1 Tax=Brevundimonas denitrificans TaxID=1443434 RepID=UPI00223A6A53|nr:hypothetical protein [Brevundimonas denitrificans]
MAEIWLSRDWTLYERWTATPAATGPRRAFPAPTAIWPGAPWSRRGVTSSTG